MKVKITKEAKRYLTIAEMPYVREIVNDLKGDETSIEEWCSIAMQAIAPRVHANWQIYNASAEICRDNATPDDRYTNGSGKLNVWLRFLAFDSFAGCYHVGCLLSDVWDMASDFPETYEAVRDHAFVNVYKRS